MSFPDLRPDHRRSLIFVPINIDENHDKDRDEDED
jgi:hypothetical protein